MKARRVLIILLTVIITSLTMPTHAMAMLSPAPQQMTVVVFNPPEDLEISIVYEEELGDYFNARISSRLWETSYQFDLCTETAGSWPHEDITILISSEEYGTFSMTFLLPHSWHDFAIRLDLETQTISQAYSHGRNLIIALCWLIPLFFIDSAIFFLFGHRKKESWKVFTKINLIMQGLFIGAWSLTHIAFWPLGIFIAPLILVVLGVKWGVGITWYGNTVMETSKARGIVCAIVMNLIGLFVVYFLATHLPLPALGY